MKAQRKPEFSKEKKSKYHNSSAQKKKPAQTLFVEEKWMGETENVTYGEPQK